MPPSISVIIPAYRAARTIGRAIDSILAQDCLPTEILVIDDGSPDDLPAALAPYGQRVTLIRQPNGGASSARNLGIDRATGELIAFLDADDYWEPFKLSRQLAIFHNHPQVGVVASRFFEQPPGQPRVGPRQQHPYTDRVLAVSGPTAFEVANVIWTSTVLVRRSALGDHRFVSGLEPAEDRDLWVRIVASHPAYIISDGLATAVLEPNSLSRGNVDFDCTSMLRVLHRHRDLLGPAALRRMEAIVYRSWACVHLADHHPRAALPPAWNRLRRQPLSPEALWVFLKSTAQSLLPPKN